jgi:hypothetical protein
MPSASADQPKYPTEYGGAGIHVVARQQEGAKHEVKHGGQAAERRAYNAYPVKARLDVLCAQVHIKPPSSPSEA